MAVEAHIVPLKLKGSHERTADIANSILFESTGGRPALIATQLNPKHCSLWFLLLPLISHTVDREPDGLTPVQKPVSLLRFNDANNHAKFNVLWGRDTYGPRKFEEAH